MGTAPKNKAIDAEYLLNQLKNLDKNILETKYVQEKDVKDTYTATDENPISGKGVAVAVNTLQQDINKKSNIGHKHTKSEITDFPTSMTPTAHNQASNTINAMTDYSKATSVSAITPTDTLNVAIGKLEKALDSKGTSSFSGSYNDLTDKPTIPSVGNGTITVNQNGTKVGEFSTNQSTNTAINLTNTTYDVATSSKLGLVKSGTDITIDSSGNVSVNDDSHNHVISNVDGLQSALDGKAASSHTHDDRYYTKTEMNTKLNGKASSSHTHGNGDITSLDASKITSGTISIDRLPQGALERLTVVADDTARFKLTSSTIQKGDTVKVTSTGKMYYVVDETKLSTEAGYEVYAAGTAASVPWSGVTGKPSTYTPSSHTHTKSQITDFPSSLPANGGNSATVNGHTVNSDVPSGAKFTDTDTWRPLGTTADTACAGNDSRLSNARPASDVYAWAKASSKPSYTKSEIGLGNVDNTADSAKSVKSSKKLQTYKQDSTTETYGDNYPVYAQWRDGSHVKMKCDNYTVETDYATSAGSASSVAWNNVTGKPSTYTPASHTHNYAGSSSAGGSANSAVKLDTATAGSATQPVYFSGGKPVACSYTLGKSVPSNAVFTDTDTKVTNTLNTKAKAYVTGTTSNSSNTGTQIFDTGVYLGTGTGQLTLEGSSSTNYTTNSSVLNVKIPSSHSALYGVNIVPYKNDNSDYLTGLNINCGTSTGPGMQGIYVNCSVNNYQPTVYINRSGTNSYALQVPKGKSYIATIYSNSSTITTSDREKKTDIQNISDKYEELFFKLQPRLFKFKDGTSGRIHIGAIAQEVEEALKDIGLSDTEFAGFVRQEKEYVVNEETGEITQEEGYDYYLRYEEFVMLLCHMLQKLYAEKEEQDNKIFDLESRIVALESKLG